MFTALIVSAVFTLNGCQTKGSYPETSPTAGAEGSSTASRPTIPPPVTEWPYDESPAAPSGMEAYQRIQRVSFATGSVTLDNESRGALNLAAETIAKNPRWHLVLVGAADTISESANAERLGNQRGDAVKRFLASKGIDDSRMSVMSLGARYAKGDKYSPETRARDRSVEVWAFMAN